MLALFRALPLLWQLGVAAAAITAIGGGAWAVHHHIWKKGYDARSAEIEAQNKEAQDGADQNRERVRACRARGGVWSQSAGECVGP